MPTLTAQHIVENDGEFPFEIELTETGGRVLASYLVNSEDINDVARQALAGTIAGAPVLGQPYAVDMPWLICRRIVPVRVGGTNGPDGTYGTTSLQVTFQSPSVSGRVHAGSAGERHTQIEVNAVAIVKAYAVDSNGDPITGGEIINNRQGVSAEVRLPAFKVSRFYPNSDFAEYDFDRLIGLQLDGAVNSDAVEVPGPPGFEDDSFGTFGAGQLRYIEWRLVDGAPGHWGIEHTVLAAPDHKARWIPEDENGNATADAQEADVWPSQSFAGLW